MTNQRRLRFVALGDSTTVGIGDAVPRSGWRGWSRLLAAELARTHRLSYTNIAVAGATSRSVRADQLPAALRLRPQLASVIVGVNDTMRSDWDPGRVRDDIVGCVAALTQAGAVVMTLRFQEHGSLFRLPGLLRRPLLRRIAEVNAAYDLAHADHGGILLDLSTHPAVRMPAYWSIDRLHPNEAGHRLLAREFAVTLQARGYELSCPATEAGTTASRWSEYWWLLYEGMPWLGRRANDLVPWMIRLAAAEATARAGLARVTSPVVDAPPRPES